MPDYGKSRLRISFSLREPLSSAIRRCLTHFAGHLFAEHLTWLARKVLSRILGAPPASETIDTVAVVGGGGGRLVVVARGRIRGEWTTPCYQLGASRLPRADKLLYPHQRTILVPNQADFSCPGLLVSLPCPISLATLAACRWCQGRSIALHYGISSLEN